MRGRGAQQRKRERERVPETCINIYSHSHGCNNQYLMPGSWSACSRPRSEHCQRSRIAASWHFLSILVQALARDPRPPT